MSPARLRRHPEDAQGAVFVGVLGVGTTDLLGDELGVLLLEGVGDVLKEDEAEYDMLVLGRVHAAAQRVGHLPQLGFVADICAGCIDCQGVGPSLCQGLPHEMIVYECPTAREDGQPSSILTSSCGCGDSLGFLMDCQGSQ